MSQLLEIDIEGEHMLLLPQRAIFRPLYRQLIVADLHMGKTTHFRKQGLPLPQQSLLKDVDKLHYLLDNWQPESVLILGDLFHSDYNREWLWFKSILLQHADVRFVLIEGNHDILEQHHYSLPNLFTAELLEEDYLIFSHQPLKNPPKLNFCGHVHPGLHLVGKARQHVSLPCFYWNQHHFILPAFGHTTGLYLLEEEKDARYFLVANDRVVKYKC